MQEVPADTVILATGVTASRELYEELEKLDIELHLIGDAKEPRKIVEDAQGGVPQDT